MQISRGHLSGWIIRMPEAICYCRDLYQGSGGGGIGSSFKAILKIAFIIHDKSFVYRVRTALYEVESCHGAALNQLGLTSGTGDDGVLPTRASSDGGPPVKEMMKGRKAHVKRQSAEGQGCQDLEKLWQDFNTSASATAQTFNDVVTDNEGSANATVDILNAICAR